MTLLTKVMGGEGLAELPRHQVRVYRRRFRLVVREVDDRGLEFAKKPVFSCAVSIGRLGFETSVNDYRILGKESPPTYTAPNVEWAIEAGYQPGEKLPEGHPMNPLRGAFLWLNDQGVGIHGTATFPLGQKASHGCIRVHPDSAISLYRLLAIGTPVVVI